MKLEGKIINFLGDSITQGFIATDLRGFPVLMKEQYGLKEARVYGLHDTRIARQQTPSPYPEWDLDFCTRAADMDPQADIIVVFGGTNDYGTGDAPLGTFADRTQDTFYGALHTLYTLLLERYPTATIVVLTPLPRITEEQPETGKNLLSYVNAIREVAAYYSLPLLDLYAQGGMQPKVPIIQQIYMPDGLHPNDAGHARLAERVGNFLLGL